MNLRLHPWLFALVLGVSALSAAPRAHALRCGTRIVVIGDPLVRVRANCGEPTSSFTRMETRSSFAGTTQPFLQGAAVTTTVQIDVWIYDFGPSRFVEEITFENGIVSALRPLGYGTQPRAARDVAPRERLVAREPRRIRVEG